MKPSLDTVTFDLWNTLLVHDESYDAGIRGLRTRDILEALRGDGENVTIEDIARAYERSDGRLAERWSSYRDMDLEEQLEVFLECLDLEPTRRLRDAIDGAYADAVLKMRPPVVEGAREAIEHVRERGFRVGLISNTGRTPGRAMRQLLKDYGLLRLFDVCTFSNEEGITKPRPEIFHKTLFKLNSTPARTVHVGDHGLLDVVGARRAGIRCVQVMQYAPCDHHYAPDVAIERIAGLPEAIEALGG